MKIIISLLIVLITISSLFAYSALYQNGLGEIVLPISAYSMGIGSCSFVFDPVLNPALQIKESQYYFAIGLQGENYRESHSEYVFDSYDNNIGKKTIYDNSFFFGEPSYIDAYMSMNNFGLFMGYMNSISMDYNYDKITRDDYYIRISERTINNSGNINTYFLSLSYNWNEYTIGGNLSILQGDAQKAFNAVYVDPSFVDSSTLYSEDYSGIAGNFSISYENDNLYTTLFYKMQATINNQRSISIMAEDTIQTADEIQYYTPNIFGFGLKLKQQNELPAIVYFEAIYERWSELNGSYATYNDLIKYHLGVSHEVINNFTLLYGVLYEPYRMNNHIVDMGISFGVSYRINQMDFNVSSQYIQNSYEENNIYYTNRSVKLGVDCGIYF